MTVLDDFKQLPNGYKWGLAGVGAGVAYFLFIRRKSKSAASGSTAPQLSTGIDPSTGVPYSQEEAAFFNQPSQGLGGLGFGSSFDPSQFFGPSSGGSASAAPAPGPTSGGTAAPSSPGVPDPTTLEQILDQQVGILSAITGHNSTSQQVQAYAAAGQKQGLTGTGLNFFEQTQNVGAISNGLKFPQLTDVNALAMQLAGGDNAFAGLPSLQQNQYKELANVELLQQLNTKAA